MQSPNQTSNHGWILSLLAALGVHNPIVGERWIVAQCPLAYWTHNKRKDVRPSFGIHVESGNFNCFTCTSGTTEKLIQLLEMYLVQDDTPALRFDLKTARAILKDKLLTMEVALPEFQEFPLFVMPFAEWPEYVLEQFIPWRKVPRAVWYLSKGRVELTHSEPVDPTIADKMDLRYDPQTDKIVCPYRTAFGKLAGARGRAIDPSSKLKHFDYSWNKTNNAHLVWYNEQILGEAALSRKPVVVVEGQFDVMNVMRVYPYVVAGLTAKPSMGKLTKLSSCTDGVIVMLDNDQTGEAAWLRYVQKLSIIKLGKMAYPKQYKDPATIPLDQLQTLFAELI